MKEVMVMAMKNMKTILMRRSDVFRIDVSFFWMNPKGAETLFNRSF